MSDHTQSPKPPILISIGSFLIDAFDTPPRPIIDKTVLPTFPDSNNISASSSSTCQTRRVRRAPPTPDSPTTPSIPRPRSPLPPLHLPNGSAFHHQALSSISPTIANRTSPNTPITTPTGSGSSTPQLDFDEPPPEHPFEYLGGGGLYSLVGARLFLPPTMLKNLVDRAPGGSDLRPDLMSQVSPFGEEMWVWNEGPLTRMTRSRIRYDGDTRFYHPTIRPPRRKLIDLINTPLQGGRYMHISPPFSAEDVLALQSEISHLISTGTPGAWAPRLVFEPTPPSCHTGQKKWLELVAPGIHVLSPNHEELLSFYGHPRMSFTNSSLVETLEQVMSHLLEDIGVGPNGQGILAVRCGRMGSCIGTKAGGLKWFPAYYNGEEETCVKDVTGAGNAFIGGYVAGLTLTNEDPYQAAIFGTVAASFVVEQVGLPSLVVNGEDHLCNGVNPHERVELLRAKWTAAGLL